MTKNQNILIFAGTLSHNELATEQFRSVYLGKSFCTKKSQKLFKLIKTVTETVQNLLNYTFEARCGAQDENVRKKSGNAGKISEKKKLLIILRCFPKLSFLIKEIIFT